MIRKIRENDYYGGDVTVAIEDSPFDGEPRAVIRWDAFGGYGGAWIAMSAGEARAAGQALVDAAGDLDAALGDA